MSLKIVMWPNNILRQESKEVRVEDIGLFSTFVDDMIQTMYEEKGVGLSAIQVGNNIRVFVVDVGLGPEVYFNPVIENAHGDERMMDEGCLSVPGVFEKVMRFTKVDGYAYDRTGNKFTFAEMPGTETQKEYRAHVIQHESEHLDGKIFLDHVSQGRREAARQAMKKLNKGK